MPILQLQGRDAAGWLQRFRIRGRRHTSRALGEDRALAERLAGLNRYDWLHPGVPERRRKQQAFFAALFLYLGHMLPLRRQQPRGVRVFLGSIMLALDLGPFHRDMANRLLALGAVNAGLAHAGVDHFGRCAADEPELAEMFVEILYDVVTLGLPGTRKPAMVAGRRLGFSDAALGWVEQRVSGANVEKLVVPASLPALSAPERRPPSALPVALVAG